MADSMDKGEEVKLPERRMPAPESNRRFEQAHEQAPEKKEVSPYDKRVSDELKMELEKMAESDEETKSEAKKKAEKIEFLGEKEKIEHLLEIARKDGVVAAIRIARQMNEPYLLDILHDTLAQEGFYKDFLGKRNSANDDDDKVK